MKNKNGRLGRRLTALCVLAALALTACEIPAAVPTQSTPPTETREAQKDSIQLDMIRQSMRGTPELFAVAYLGEGEKMAAADVIRWACENNPQLLRTIPFLADIPESAIIGNEGEAYCIIPRDKSAEVMVHQMVYNANGNFVPGQLLYRSHNGDPFILFCNSSDYGLDSKLTITELRGESVSWSAGIDDAFVISLPTDAGGKLLAWDISLYEAGPRDIYHDYYQSGWQMPYEDTLTGTRWTATGIGPDGREAVYELILNGNGTAGFSWRYTDTAATQEYYYGSWELLIDHRAFLKLELKCTTGVLYTGAEVTIADSFAVLYHPEEDRLLVGFSMYGSTLPMDPPEKDVLGFFQRLNG